LGENELGRDPHLGRTRRSFFLRKSGKTLIRDRFLLGESDPIGGQDGSQDIIGHRRRRWVSRRALLVLRRRIPFLEILFCQNFGEIPKALGGILDRKALGEIRGRSDG
jgi:hypothetical protein